MWKTPGVCATRGPKKPRCEVPISREPIAPDNLEEPEEDFFTVVAAGNIGALRQFLNKHRKPNGTLDFDINCVNFQNDNAMTVAVDKGNLDIIKCLVQLMNVTKNSILLKAIHRGDIELVRSLCESLSADEEALDNFYKMQDGESDYPTSMTPLMVAAIEGHYEIVGYLIERGHQIGDMHPPDCMCKEACKTMLSISDRLHLSSSTFYIYSAMSSTAYIPYATADPIHYCFQLHRRLKNLSKVDPPFKSRYETLAHQVAEFAASVVSQCCSCKEVELILKQSYPSQKPRKGPIQSEYPRLLMAIEFDQKEFIAQPKVQLAVQNIFYGAIEDWSYSSTAFKCKYIFYRLLTIPIAYFSFLASPKSPKSTYYAAPINKMLHYLAMHLIFLGVLFMETRTPKQSAHRSLMISAWSPLIFVYFYGLAGSLAYHILNAGFKRFLRFYWNLYDLVMVMIFSLFVAFSISSLVHVRMLGIRLRERKMWSPFDPQLISEGFLVIATIMAYMRTVFFLQVHSVFGPMITALGQLAKHLACFSLFGVIVLFGYSLALSHFYSYYSGMTYVDPVTDEKSSQEESFMDFSSSLKTFFWGFLGQTESSVADVVLATDNEHLFTQAIGYLALGSYLVLMIWVFKSMLIAVAVKCCQSTDVHKAWLFRRTQIFMYFIDSPLLPPPFNLFPHRYTLAYLRTAFDLERANKEKGPKSHDEYKELAKALVERYFRSKYNLRERTGRTHPDTNCGDTLDKCNGSRCRSL